MFHDICLEEDGCGAFLFSNQCMIEASVALMGLKRCDDIWISPSKGFRSGSTEGETGSGDLSLLYSDSDTFYDAIGSARSPAVASGVIDLINHMGQAHVLHARFLPGGGFRCSPIDDLNAMSFLPTHFAIP